MGLSQKYDSFYASNELVIPFEDVQPKGWPRHRVEAILMDAPVGGTVLDLGCGDGFLLYQLRDRYAELVGMEFSPHRLEQARQNLQGLNFRGYVGSAEDMAELDSGCVDTLVMADVIEHVADVYAAASEMFRVLKPGGLAIINTPNIAFIKKRLFLLAGRFPSTSQPNEGLGSDILFDGGHLHYFTFRSLSLLLARAGFELLHRTGFGPLGQLSQLWPSMLSSGVQVVARRAH